VSGGHVGNPLAEDVPRATGVGAEELAKPEDEDELATANGQVAEDAAVTTVDAVGWLAADQAERGPGAGW